jgi:hypothetical protein
MVKLPKCLKKDKKEKPVKPTRLHHLAVALEDTRYLKGMRSALAHILF